MALTVNDLLPFSPERRAYRAFDHALAAAPGLVAAVPLVGVSGPLLELVDGCPVPWDEACAVIAAQPESAVLFDSPDFAPALARLAAFAADGWRMAPLPAYRAVVFGHESGLKVALAADLVFRPAPPTALPY